MSARSRARWLALLLLGSTLGTASVAPAQEAETFRSFPYISLVGDLNGDGITDGLSREHTKPVLEVADVGGVLGYQSITSGRNGIDGSRMWTATDLDGSLTPAPLGPEGGQGFLEVDGAPTDGFCECTTGSWADNDAHVFVLLPARGLDLVARNGQTEVLWQRSFAPPIGLGGTLTLPSGETRAYSYTDHPMFGGLVQATPSAALDVLAVFSSRQDVNEEAEASVRMEILDGATGHTTASWTVTTDGRQPTPRTVGDLDGDGLDDVVVANDPQTGALSAYRGTDGRLLWRNLGIDLDRYIDAWDTGDLDGDGRSELQAGSVASIFWDTPDPTVHLLDGATGQQMLSTDAGHYTPVGDIDDDGDTELVRATPKQQGQMYSVTYEQLDLAGTVLRTATHAQQGDNVVTSLGFDGIVGDVNGDGIDDLGQHTLQFGGSRLWEGVVVDGATLERFFEAPALQPVRASLDGAGDDFVGVRKDGRTLVVTGQDGLTGAILWERRFPVDEDVDMLNVGWRIEAADLDGDGLADVLVNAQLPVEGSKDPTSENYINAEHAAVPVWALSGETGATLWSV